MPGWSLWLIPPPSSELNEVLQRAILDIVPDFFRGYRTEAFIPHVTLTSTIEPEKTFGSDAQLWLDALPLANGTMTIELQQLQAGEPFFKKLTIRILKETGIRSLVGICRRAARADSDSEEWVEREYLPHLSLLYADIDVDIVEQKILELSNVLQHAVDDSALTPPVVCEGGKVVLVNTTKPVGEWAFHAQRELSNTSWTWKLETN